MLHLNSFIIIFQVSISTVEADFREIGGSPALTEPGSSPAAMEMTRQG